jgi:hypothetical protein
VLHLISQTRCTKAGSNRLTVDVIRNQQPLGPEQLEAEGRNRRTLDETNIDSPQAVWYLLHQLVGMRRSLARHLEEHNREIIDSKTILTQAKYWENITP